MTGRYASASRLTLPEIDLTFAGNLRPYQEQAVTGILNKEFGVLEAGTGSGKTIMALAVIAVRKQPPLILVHTKELLFRVTQTPLSGET